jgi:hypothetical protein
LRFSKALCNKMKNHHGKLMAIEYHVKNIMYKPKIMTAIGVASIAGFFVCISLNPYGAAIIWGIICRAAEV